MVKTFNKQRSGYTLIEMVAVIGILALVISLTAGVLLAVVRAYDNQRVYAEIQRNGDFVMRFIEESVRNANSVSCVEVHAAGLAQPCTGAYPRILEISDNNDTYYIGMHTDEDNASVSTDDVCGGAEEVRNFNNGYIFLLDNISFFTSNDYDSINFDEYKMTNDSARGIDVNDFSFRITDATGEPTQVIVTMDISDSVCSVPEIDLAERKVRSFQSFVTVRGSYSN